MGSWDALATWLLRGCTYGGIMLATFAAMTLITAAAPGFVKRERDAARAGMRRCFLWGAVFLTNVALLCALLLLVDGLVGRVLALAVLVVALVVGLAGLSAIAAEVGRRVLMLAESYEPNALARLAVGTLVLFFTGVVPVLGWLVFAGALLTGVGAFLETAAEDYRPTRRPVEGALGVAAK